MITILNSPWRSNVINAARNCKEERTPKYEGNSSDDAHEQSDQDTNSHQFGKWISHFIQALFDGVICVSEKNNLTY